MNPARTGPRFLIHPSIDSLVERIAGVRASTPATDVAALRQACLGKVRSYSADSYLRTVPDAVAGRDRYQRVVAFSTEPRSERPAPAGRSRA